MIHLSQAAQPQRFCDVSNVSQWPWMTTGDKFQRYSFKLTSKLNVKSVRGRLFTFYIFETKRIAGSGSYSYEDFSIGAGAGAAGASTFCPEPKPEPPKSFIRSRSRSRSRNTSPEPEPTKNVTAPHPCVVRMHVNIQGRCGTSKYSSISLKF